uniref:methionyl aminopeptidase n=2 Tax=Clostridia TaxID=186801 RepID=UPI00321C234A
MNLSRNDHCWCGSNKKYKNCHLAFDEKIHSYKLKGHIVPPRSIIKTPEQIEKIKESAAINTAVLDLVSSKIKAGMSTEEINTIVHDFTISQGAIPAPLNFQGYPKSVCTSLNDEVCHGIPSEDVILEDGDIINVDVSTIYN